MCKNNNILIANGRVGSDKFQGNFTTDENSTIDYVLLSPGILSNILYFEVNRFDPMLSDVHKGISFTFKLNKESKIILEKEFKNKIKDCKDCNENINYTDKLKPKSIWKEDTHLKIATHIETSGILELNNLVDDLEIDTLLDIYQEEMIEILEKSDALISHNNKRKKVDNNQAWFNNECKSAQRIYRKAKRNYNRIQNNENKIELKLKSLAYKKELKKARYKFLRDKRNELKKAKKNPKEYWKILNFKNKKGQVKASTRDLFEHFKKLNDKNINDTIMEDSNANRLIDNNVIDSEILDKEISEEEVIKAISSLKNDKACGTDSIRNEFIKATDKHLLSFYTKIFNKVLESGNIPESWTVGVIIPIYKNKGDEKDPSNYRGITLLSCLGKVFTKIINERLELFAETFKLIKDNQAGFRKKHSTTDHIFVLYSLIDICLRENRKLFVAWIDYAKAFDTVWRDGLWYKMTKANISTKIINLIRNMYSNIKTKIFNNNEFSNSFISHSGVRQGENLSPFLFALYVNDLEDFLEENNFQSINISRHEAFNYMKLYLILYADDTIIISNSKDNLQRGLDLLKIYCDEWKLSVNVDKTKITVFEKRKCDYRNIKLEFNNKLLEVVSLYKYLGILFKSNGSFKDCIKRLCEQANKAMFMLLKKARELDLSVDTQIELFHKLITPILTYGCEVWGFTKTDIVDNFHLKFLRYILKLKKNTPIPMIYGETGEVPISIIIKTRMISYYASLKDPNNPTLAKKMFEIHRLMHESNVYTTNWLNCINNIANECGLVEYFNNDLFVNKKSIKIICKQKLKENFIKQWNNRLRNLSKCDLYYLFKNNFEQEKYLKILPYDLAIVLCRYRTSNHKLEVEKQRYDRPFVQRMDRKCTKCTLNETGNEYHHLLICPYFKDERKQFIDKKFTSKINFIKVLDLLESKNSKILYDLSIFIKITLKKYQ